MKESSESAGVKRKWPQMKLWYKCNQYDIDIDISNLLGWQSLIMKKVSKLYISK